MAVKFTSQEISRKYDRFARWYDWLEGVPDVLGVSRLRHKGTSYFFCSKSCKEKFDRNPEQYAK
jgi:hypothetical protein